MGNPVAAVRDSAGDVITITAGVAIGMVAGARDRVVRDRDRDRAARDKAAGRARVARDKDNPINVGQCTDASLRLDTRLFMVH
jgi:hypothetical protein